MLRFCLLFQWTSPKVQLAKSWYIFKQYQNVFCTSWMDVCLLGLLVKILLVLQLDETVYDAIRFKSFLIFPWQSNFDFNQCIFIPALYLVCNYSSSITQHLKQNFVGVDVMFLFDFCYECFKTDFFSFDFSGRVHFDHK